MRQYVNFPTRGPNTLDLIICNSPGSAEALPNFGTSDHVAIKFTCIVDSALDSEPPNTPVLNWMTAPWNHIGGAVKRALSAWNDSDYDSPDEAEAQLAHYNPRIGSITSRGSPPYAFLHDTCKLHSVTTTTKVTPVNPQQVFHWFHCFPPQCLCLCHELLVIITVCVANQQKADPYALKRPDQHTPLQVSEHSTALVV